MSRALQLFDRRESGPKHDLWVVPYADMVTLLFAMFVVLYSIGETRIQKLHQLRQSIAYHLSLGGAGGISTGTFPSTGETAGRGEILDGVQLINAQPEEMKRFVLDTLPESFAEVSGKSLEIVLTDDTIEFSADLASFFEPGDAAVRADVQIWIVQMFEGVWGHVSQVRLRMEAPDVVVGRDANGRLVRTDQLCARRLQRLRQLLRLVPQVDPLAVITEFHPQAARPGDWEANGRIRFAFSDP